MDRETKTFTTPSGIEIEMHTYMIGSEMMDLEAVGVEAGFKSIDGKGSMKIDALAAYTKRKRKLVDLIVVSVAGEKDKEKIWSAIENMKGKDFMFTMQNVEKCAEGLDEEDVKK